MNLTLITALCASIIAIISLVAYFKFNAEANQRLQGLIAWIAETAMIGIFLIVLVVLGEGLSAAIHLLSLNPVL